MFSQFTFVVFYIVKRAQREKKHQTNIVENGVHTANCSSISMGANNVKYIFARINGIINGIRLCTLSLVVVNETYDENGGRQEEEESMYTQTNKKNVSERPTFYGSNILW